MILIDFAGHMVSTESEEELHTFADKLGMDRKWYQDRDKSLGFNHPHYDVFTPRLVGKAIELGAEEVTPRELVERAWWRKDNVK